MAVALIVAAGSGERLGAGRPKAFVLVAGRPMLAWSVDALRAVAAIDDIVVALPPGERAPAGTIGVAGGATRSQSVAAALAAAPAGADPVLVHDAARPLLTAALVTALLAELDASGCEGAIPAVPVPDTLRRGGPTAGADGGGGGRGAAAGGAAGEAGGIVAGETVDRAGLWAVQTPQAFRRAALEDALDVDPDILSAATDDAALVARAGGRVRIVPSTGGPNFKVTTPADLELAELVLRARG